MVLDRPRTNVEGCIEGKGDGGQASATRQRKARPLQNFPKKVGPAHVLEHTTAGNLVPRFAGFPEIAQHRIGVPVDGDARPEQQRAKHKAWGREVLVPVRLNGRQVLALDVTVHGRKENRRQHNEKGGRLAAPDPERKDYGAIEIMKEKHPQQDLVGRLGRGVGGSNPIQIEGNREAGKFLDDPRDLAVYQKPVGPGAAVASVGGGGAPA